jgi:integrase/recombinase XerD
MNKPTASAILLAPNKQGICKISIRVTIMRERKYYPTGITALPADFDRAMKGKRRKDSDTALLRKVNSHLEKALNVIESLPAFTFALFEERYLNNREAIDSLKFHFDRYISELKDEKRIGTAVSYQCAINSLERFRPGMKFADITPAVLKKYEAWMQEAGNGITSVGIYMRSLRTIFNRAEIDKTLYPFGDRKGKYSIPIGRNIKKALTMQDIAKIYNYKPEPDSTEEMARDYWIFLYLCNGMNVKDFCLLKRKNIEGHTLKFYRAKTKRSKREQEEIRVSLKPQAKAVITKWGMPSLHPEAFVFPHLQKGISAAQERQVIQQLTKTINKYMKRISKALELDKEVTTYFARHSFATILKNSGASYELIGELLGHGSTQTTRSYLDGFEQDTIHKQTDVLISGLAQ